MPLPTLILNKVKDRLRIPATVITHDAVIGAHYEIALKELLLGNDFLVEIVPIAAVADQSIYPLSPRVIRLLSLFHNGFSLLRVPSRTNDLLTSWETEPSGTPETFTLDALPVGLDVPTANLPDQVLVRPAPAVSATGDAGFMAWEVVIPENLAAALVLPYLVPYLTYATAARVLELDIEIRDLPASRLWGQFATLWLSVIQATVRP